MKQISLYFFRWLAASGLTLLAVLTTPLASAQSFPSKPITVVAPLVAGSNIANAIRLIGEETSKTIGQPVIVEYKPGALFRLGLQAIQTAPSDGYTLAVVIDGLVISQAILDPAFNIRPHKDYVPINFLMSYPLALISSAKFPPRDIAGMIAYAKANPGKVNVAVSPGTSPLYTTAMFSQEAGIKLNLVPYKDTSQAIPDLLEGRVDMTFTGTIALPHVEAGKLVGLATTGKARWQPFPKLPTLREATGKNIESEVWLGIVAAPRTPADVVTKLNGAINAALKSAAVDKQLQTIGMAAGSGSPEQFSRFITSELDRWTPILKGSGVDLKVQ